MSPSPSPHPSDGAKKIRKQTLQQTNKIYVKQNSDKNLTKLVKLNIKNKMLRQNLFNKLTIVLKQGQSHIFLLKM